MQFNQNVAVYSADGQEIGRLDRVVIDPRTNEVTHLIIQQGLLLTEDKVVPVDLVAQTDEHRVDLNTNADHLHDLPMFEETLYVSSDGSLHADFPAESARELYAYPPVPGTMMGGYPVMFDPVPAPTIAHTARNIPEETVALKEGARVLSSDGEHVGNIERVFTASDTVTHFLIAQGLLFKAHKLVPMNWVDSISEDEVHLAVSADYLQSLHDYQPS